MSALSPVPKDLTPAQKDSLIVRLKAKLAVTEEELNRAHSRVSAAASESERQHELNRRLLDGVKAREEGTARAQAEHSDRVNALVNKVLAESEANAKAAAANGALVAQLEALRVQLEDRVATLEGSLTRALDSGVALDKRNDAQLKLSAAEAALAEGKLNLAEAKLAEVERRAAVAEAAVARSEAAITAMAEQRDAAMKAEAEAHISVKKTAIVLQQAVTTMKNGEAERARLVAKVNEGVAAEAALVSKLSSLETLCRTLTVERGRAKESRARCVSAATAGLAGLTALVQDAEELPPLEEGGASRVVVGLPSLVALRSALQTVLDEDSSQPLFVPVQQHLPVRDIVADAEVAAEGGVVEGGGETGSS